jgi:hypothetical protein
MANIKANELPEKTNNAVSLDRVILVDSED